MQWLAWSAIPAALLTASLVAQTAAERRDAGRFPPPGRRVDIGGRSLHILCKGNAPGPTVVVEQGAGSPSILWWSIQDRVAAFARICTYDRADYLWSDPAAPTRSLEARVADLHALLHAADIPGPYILVAHSFGGALVRLFTQTYPSEVAGLVLIDTTEEATIFRPSFTAYTAKLALFARAASLAARGGLVRQATTLFMRKTPPGFTPDSYGALKAFIAKPGFFRAMRDDVTCLTRVPAAMRRIGGFGGTLGDRPLVVITHTEPFPGPAAVLEPGWAEGQARLASLSTRGSLLRAEGCNHMIPGEAPGLVVEAIRTVLNQCRETAPIPAAYSLPKDHAGDAQHHLQMKLLVRAKSSSPSADPALRSTKRMNPCAQ
jgi:pimeloyl-ACP methyl ester carboxylesterase